MKIRKILIITIITCLTCFDLCAQISTNEEPYSFTSTDRSLSLRRSTEEAVLVSLPVEKKQIEKEDIDDEANGIPPRFGYSIPVNYNMENSGRWTKLDDGGRLWQLTIYSPGAVSINLLYDKMWLPEGAKFYIYSTDKKQHIGAFTTLNNKGDRTEIEGFATGLVYSDKITLEYYEPINVSQSGVISIAHVIHGYRYINISENILKSFGQSGNCNVNINCPEGNGWQDEKNAVALILVNGNRYCTGSLINTTANDYRPLFLTADHCLGGWGNNNVKYDAISNPNLNHWSFYWNYESPACTNTTEPIRLSTSGAVVVANNDASDFALLRLTENPHTIYNTFYLGWDRSGNVSSGGVGIHHPSGDVKKISTYTSALQTATYSNVAGAHWRVTWARTSTNHSITEGGSSGSPLINSNHHVVGQLHGGSASCSNLSGPDYYGKFNISWTGNNATDPRRRLRDWLDPVGSNPTTLSGSPIVTITGPEELCSSNTSYSIANLPTGATVNWSVNSHLRIVSTSTDGKTVTISPYSSLRGFTAGIITAIIAHGGQTITVAKTVYGGLDIVILGPTTVPQTTGASYKAELAGYVYPTPFIEYYSWSVTNGSVMSGNISDAEIMFGIGNRTSTITVTYANGCGGYSTGTLNVYVSRGGMNYYSAAYPNPASSSLTIERVQNSEELQVKSATPSMFTAQLYSLSRQLVREQTFNGTQLSLNVSTLPNGTYFLNIIENGKVVEQQTIVVAH